MVICAVRAVGMPFARIVTPTEPLPVPEDWLRPTHGALLEAAHAQLAPFTVMPICPAALPWPYGVPNADVFRLTEHGSAACVTWKLWPPITIVPTRGEVSGFGAAVYSTVPPPVPEPPEVIAIHAGVDVVSYAQPSGVLTFSEPGPPSAGADAEYGLSDRLQPVPGCWTVSVCPAIVAVNVRDGAPVFGRIVTCTRVSVAAPDDGVASRPLAVHPHVLEVLDALIRTVAVPPAAGAVIWLGVIAKPHPLVPNCVIT
jgi:hypothetical protein